MTKRATKWTRRRKWIVGAACALVVVLVVAALVGRSMLSAHALKLIQAALTERYGVDVHADDLSVSPLRGIAEAQGFRIQDGGETVLEAERVEVRARFADVIDGRLDWSKLVLVRPVLRIVVEKDGRTNLKRILSTPRKSPAIGPEGLVVLRDARAEDGRIEFVDAVTKPETPLRVVLRDVKASVSELQLAGESATESSADLRLDAGVEQPGFPARLSIVAWGRKFTGDETFSLHAALTGYDLRQIPQYVSATQRLEIGGSFMHFAMDIEARRGVIEPGAIVGEVAGTGTVLPMRVGGTTSDPVFEDDSDLGTLFQIPLGHFGSFGEVTVGAGWSVVKGGVGALTGVGGGVLGAGESLGGGLVDAGGDLVSLDPLGALQCAGGGVVGAGESVGKGVLEGIKRLFGGGSEIVNSLFGVDAKEMETRFAQLHAKRRAALLRAALTSVPKGVAAARRKRIAAEVDASAVPSGG